MVTAVRDAGVWKEPNVIYAKDADVWKEVAASDLRLIGAQYSATASMTLAPWESLKEGDLVLLFAADTSDNGAITPPAGFAQIRTTSATTTDRLSAFYAFAGAGGSLGSITAAGARALSALVYRGAGGIGVSAQNVSATSTTTQTVSLTGLSEGSLIAAALPFDGQLQSTSPTIGLGWSIPNNARFSATTLGPLPASPGTRTPTFTLSAGKPMNVIGVEILSK